MELITEIPLSVWVAEAIRLALFMTAFHLLVVFSRWADRRFGPSWA